MKKTSYDASYQFLLIPHFLVLILVSFLSHEGPLSDRVLFVATAFQSPVVSLSSNTNNSLQRRFIIDTCLTATTTATTKSETPLRDEALVTEKQNKYDGPIILFDGVCNFCNAWVDILLRIDLQKKFKFAPLQSTIGQELLISIGRQPDDITSVIYIDGTTNEWYDKSDCVLQVIKTLGVPGIVGANVAQTWVPVSLRNQIYDMVAKNRYNLLGKRDECRCGDFEYRDRFLT